MKLRPNWQDAFEDYLQEFKTSYEVPGIAVSALTADDVFYQKGVGYRNLQQELPVTPNTMFGVASITKSFTALALLQLATKGLISLDDPVSRYLPDLHLWNETKAATLYHFLSHTSGLPALPGLTYAMALSQKGDPIEQVKKTTIDEDAPRLESYSELVSFLNQHKDKVLGEPGAIFCYQNDAYGLLGAVIEQVTGQSYASYVEENIIQPLGMTRTTFDLTRVVGDNDSTTLYAKDDHKKTIESPLWQEAPAHVGAGFLRSTAYDLALYTQFYLNKHKQRVLAITDNFFPEMLKPVMWCKPNIYYGLGLMIYPDYYGVTLIGHSGGLKGVSSYFGFVPELGIGAAILANLADVPVDQLWLGFINTVLEIPLTTPWYVPQAYDASPDELRAVLGEYESGEPWGKINLHLKNNSLYALVGNEGDIYPAWLAGPNELVVERDGYNVGGRFLRTPEGKIEAIHYSLRVLKKKD